MSLGLWAADSLKLWVCRLKAAARWRSQMLWLPSSGDNLRGSTDGVFLAAVTHSSVWLSSSHTHTDPKRLWTIPHRYSKQNKKTVKWDTSTRGERAQNTQWHHHNFLFLPVAMIPGNLHTSGDWWMMSQEGRAQFLLSGHNRTSSLCVPPESWAKYGRDLLHPLGQRRSEWPNSLHSLWPIGIHDIMLTRPHK